MKLCVIFYNSYLISPLKLYTMKLLYIHLQTLKDEGIANKAEIILTINTERARVKRSPISKL